MAVSKFPALVLRVLPIVLAGPALAQGAGQSAQVPATALEPVTTIGTKTERTRDEVPNAVTIVGPEEIERRSPSKLDDLINDIPNVEMIGGPRRAGQDFNIRGFEGNRVVTIIDGARSNFDAGHKGRIFQDPDLLKQVEVLKGPASALRGTGAIGGVVSLTTKDAADFLDAGESYAFRGKYGYSSAARENLYSATHVGRPVKYFDYLANYTYRPGGTIQQGGDRELVNSAEDLRTGLFKVGVNPADNHRVSLTHQLVKDNAKVPLAVDSATTSTNFATRHYVENQTTSLNYGYRNPEGGWLSPNVTIYENKFHISDDYNVSSTTTRTDITDLMTTGFDIYNTSRFEGFGSHAVTYGVEYFRDDQAGYRNSGVRPGYPRANRDVYGYYLQDEITLGAVSLSPGLRYDSYEQTNDTTAVRSESKASPKLGGIWRVLPWMSFVGSYAQAFRAPSLTELYISGTSGPHTFIANPDLKPEKTETYEGGLRFKFNDVAAARDTLRISVTGFYTKAEDFIDTVQSGSTITYQNITRATIDGAEAEAMYDMSRVFAGLGVSRVRGNNDVTGQHISSMPADKLSLTAGGKAPDYDMIYGWRSRFYARQSRIDTTSTTLETGGYAVHGIFASWMPSQERLAGLRLDLGVDNLFDKLYRRHGTGLYEEGRDYHGAVSYAVKF